MHKNYLYSVTDKALFDALNNSKISNSELRDLFLSRGVIISTESERKDLATEFSKYNHDYYDHQRIASAMGVYQRKEKTTTSDYSTEIDKEYLEETLNSLKRKINNEDDLCIWYQDNDGNYIVDVTYEAPDYSKSEFKQIVKKEAKIIIEETENGYTIRYPDNPKIHDYEGFIKTSFIDKAKELEQDFDYSRINLAAIDDPEIRTGFFNKLLNSMDGYEVTDVTDVYVFHPKPTAEEKEQSEELGVHITKASLKGEGVLKSGELQQFYERGFYISKTRWMFKEKDVDSDIYVVEVMFSNPETFQDFSYISRGKYKYKSQGAYNKNTSKLDEKEELKISRIIESTAKDIINGILSETLEGDGDGSSETKVNSNTD